MKKILLSIAALMLCLCTFAQNRQKSKTIYDLKSPGPIKHIANARMYSGEEISSGTTGLGPVNHSAKISGITMVIGDTQYDLQSNAASVCGRVYNIGNTIGAAWTYSTDPNGTWPDRGTGVNYSFDNGSSWGVESKVENDRRGFGTLDKLGSGEVVVSHALALPMDCYYRATAGTGTWTLISSIPGPDTTVTTDEPLWPSMRAGGANNSSIHVIALTTPVGNGGAIYNGVDGLLLYNRSTDGGLTWDIQNLQLPDMDSLNYVRVRANSYSIDVRGDVVAIVSCGAFDDWTLWKSTDNGTTWTKTVIYDFPFTKYNYDTDITDTIPQDGVADIVPSTDGTCAVVIDNNNVAHCFAGGIEVIQDPTGTAGIGFVTNSNAILYWNENMLANPAVAVAGAEDFDGDLMITDAAAQYGFLDGTATMPTAGVDAYNNIYLAYSAVMENTDDGNGVMYRNVYACASNDNGTTWLPAVNISNDAFGEAVFPCMARDIDIPGCLHLMWQNDGAPGMMANATPPASALCDIDYNCVDPIAELGIVLGVNENHSSALQVSMSPNPSNDFTMLNFNLDKPSSIKVDIVNINGQHVAQYNEDAKSAGAFSIKIKTSELNAGIYSVSANVDGKIYTDKLVVK